MRERRRRSGGFLCFTVDDAEDEAEARGGSACVAQNEDHLPRRRLYRRALGKIFASRSGKERKESSCSISRKGSGSSKGGKSVHDDDWGAVSIYSSSSLASASSLSSSSSSNSSSSSSSSSRLSMAALAALAEQSESKTRRNLRSSQGTAENKSATTGLFLLLASLSMMVFCGRLSAILWMSWLLFVACGYSSSEPTGGAAAAKEVDDCMLSSEIRRRRLVEEAEEKKRVILKGILARNKKV